MVSKLMTNHPKILYCYHFTTLSRTLPSACAESGTAKDHCAAPFFSLCSFRMARKSLQCTLQMPIYVGHHVPFGGR